MGLLDFLHRRSTAGSDAIQAWRTEVKHLASQRSFKEAIKLYDKVLKADPKNIKALNYKGAALTWIGTPNRALDCYEKALALKPSDIGSLHNKAVLLWELGRRSEAKECLEKASQLDGQCVEVLVTKLRSDGWVVDGTGIRPLTRT